jgi:hypothetical protein
MRELQQAIEQACRDIERYLDHQGHKVAVGFKGMKSERSQVHSDLLVLTVDLLVKHLGKLQKSGRIHFNGKDIPTPGSFSPPRQAVTTEQDAGYRAGVRALLVKYQQAIQNATDLAEGRPTMMGLQQVTEKAKLLRPDDPVPKMLIAVAQVRKELCERDLKILELTKSLEEKKGPEEQLRERLKLKMRAKYLEKATVLREFQTYIFENYSAMFPETVPRGQDGRDVVSEFLERVGDGEDQR